MNFILIVYNIFNLKRNSMKILYNNDLKYENK